MTDWLLPFLCGLGASVISAWGVGGGTLLLLVMTLFLGVEQRTAQGINLLFFLPAAVSALAEELAVAPAALGPWAATAMDPELLRKPFGVYLLLSGVSLLLPQKPKDEPGGGGP